MDAGFGLILLALAALTCYRVALPSGDRVKLLPPILWLGTGFLLIIVLVGFLFRSEVLIHGSVSEQQILGLKKEIAQLAPTTKNIIVFNGGSYTHRAVNGAQIEKALTAEGYPTEVLTVSLPGANHFERSMILRRIIGLLERVKSQQPNINFVYLNELHSGYDLNPLAQVRQISDRMISYTTPAVAWRATKAAQRFWPDILNDVAERETLETLWRAAAFNAFGLGQLRSAKIPYKARNFPGYRPMNNRAVIPQKDFDVAQDFLTQLSPERIEAERQAQDLPASTEHRAWLTENVDPELTKRFDTLFAQQRYFLPFTTKLRDLVYFAHQCGFADNACMRIDNEYVSQFSAISEQSFWIDPNHVSKAGSVVFTNWLTQHIIEEEVLVP